jgi:type VI secretion system secreted protein VgrG
MSDTRTQEHRALGISTPLGDDALLLLGVHGSETLGRLFQFDLELMTENAPVDYTKILGKNVTVRLNMLNDQTRYFNGYISRFIFVSMDESKKDHKKLYYYRATMVPWTWFLTRRADCRIFQDMKVQDIIEKIFRDTGFTDFKSQLSGTYRTWEYCVQYRETDFNFISRLMENEGIYYYFEHENGKHTLVLCDSPTAHKPASGYDDLHFDQPDLSSTHDAYIWEWTIAQEITSNQYALTDFNPLQPKAELFRSINVEHTHDPGTFEIFDYPGGYTTGDEGRAYAKSRIEETEAQYVVAHGVSSARGIFAGCTFTLKDHPTYDAEEYLITSITYHLTNDEFGAGHGRSQGGATYEVRLACMPSQYEFRAPRTTPKPVVQGPQTAIVVGPSGEEIYTDSYGRVKVHFHWDRDSSGDEKSSCWIRVAQNWAGKKWGIMFIPRTGQEVIVDFLEGDPDRPIITGRVYNGENMPPYDLPSQATKSTIKSYSSKGGGGFNEFRFEDKKGSEQIFMHAQRQMDIRVGANYYETNGGNREMVIGADNSGDRNVLVAHDENMHITNDRFDKVDDVFNQHILADVMWKYDSNWNVYVSDAFSLSANDIVLEASDGFSIGADALKVTGSTSLDLKGDAVKIQGTQSMDLKTAQLKIAGDSMVDFKGGTVNVEGSTVSIKGNMAVNIEGGMSLSLKVGGNAVVIDPSGVSIHGTMVKINMGAAGAAASSAAAAAEAAEADHAEDFDVTDPIDAAAADTGQPGAHGTGTWTPRTHTTIHVTPHQYPPLTPPPGQPSQPSGSSGGPGTQDQDIELVELVEVVHHAGGDAKQSPSSRKQYVNMAAANDHPEFTRIIKLKARVRWRSGDQSRSLAGKSVHWYFTAGGSNRASLAPASLKGGFDSNGGAEHKDTSTDSDGWTPVVEFHASQYGGDEFTPSATLDPGYTGGLQAGTYTVWRRLFYEVDCMNRVDGGTFSNVVNEAGIRGEFARQFVEVVKVGRDSTPAYRRVLMSNDVAAFATSVRDQNMSPRYFHLIYVDTIAQTFEQATPAGSSNQSVTVALRRPGVANDNKMPLPANTYCIDASNWFRSCGWVQGTTSGTLDQAKCRLVERPSYANAAANGDGWDVEVDLSGVGDPSAAVNVTLNFKSMDELSGLNTGIETIVGLRFRETRYGRGSANAIASTQRTSTHEPGHAMGMVATTLPDGNPHPNVITTQGTHCTFNTDQCCMFRAATNFVVRFCPNCSDALRGRKLESIPLQGTAGYT